MKRRSFLHLLILATCGCHSQTMLKSRPAQKGANKKPSLTKPAGRVLAVNNSTAEVFEIDQWGSAFKLFDLPAGFHSTLPRAGYGPRLCSFTPSGEPDLDGLLQTVQLNSAGRLTILPDRYLPAGFLPHLHLADEDMVLATQTSSKDDPAKILLLDARGKSTIFASKFQGEVRLAASLKQYLALFTVKQSRQNQLVGEKIYLFERDGKTLKPTAELEVPELSNVPSAISYLSGLTFIEIEKKVQLCLSISSTSAQDVVLIYTITDSALLLTQKITGLNAPGALIAQKDYSAICQQQNGEITTYKWGGNIWGLVDSLAINSGLSSPQSTNKSGIVFLGSQSGTIWCCSLDSKARLSRPPVPVSGLSKGGGNAGSKHTVVRQILD